MEILAVMYPLWSYYPRNERPPAWSQDLVEAVRQGRHLISSVEAGARATRSDDVLRALAPSLQSLGFTVERDKTRDGKIRRPVLYGENGREEVSYEVDGFHDGLGIVLEVEAGRGAQNNAAYRDIVRTSLIMDAKNLALVLPVHYRFHSGGDVQVTRAYEKFKLQLDAIYLSNRIRLPFDGTLLIGY